MRTSARVALAHALDAVLTAVLGIPGYGPLVLDELALRAAGARGRVAASLVRRRARGRPDLALVPVRVTVPARAPRLPGRPSR